jgi:hypothetical protein
VNTDAYMERPYADAAADESRHEAFQDTRAYRSAFRDWVMYDHTAHERFEATDAYDDAFEAWVGGDA